jgi:uncharacterized membrane protein YbhN (UPF0104 family)
LKKTLLNAAKVGISLALVGYLVWDAMNRGESAFVKDGRFAPEVLWAVGRHAAAHWPWLVAASIACFVAVLLTLVRWYYLVLALGLPLRFSEAMRIGFLGYMFNLAPFGIVGGDLLKAWLLARIQHGRRPEAVATVVVDRLVGLYLLFVVASAAILLTGFWQIDKPFVQWTCKLTLVVTAVSTVGVISSLLPDYTQGKSTRWLAKIPKVGTPLLKLVNAVHMYRHHLAALGVSGLMSVAVHSFFTLGIFLIANGMYEDVPGLGVHFVLSPVSAATGVLPIALGPFEWVLDRLYIYTPTAGGGTMALGQGLVVAFGYRIITVLIALVGAGYYLTSRREVAEALHEAEEEPLVELEAEPAAGS